MLDPEAQRDSCLDGKSEETPEGGEAGGGEDLQSRGRKQQSLQTKHRPALPRVNALPRPNQLHPGQWGQRDPLHSLPSPLATPLPHLGAGNESLLSPGGRSAGSLLLPHPAPTHPCHLPPFSICSGPWRGGAALMREQINRGAGSSPAPLLASPLPGIPSLKAHSSPPSLTEFPDTSTSPSILPGPFLPVPNSPLPPLSLSSLGHLSSHSLAPAFFVTPTSLPFSFFLTSISKLSLGPLLPLFLLSVLFSPFSSPSSSSSVPSPHPASQPPPHPSSPPHPPPPAWP